MDGVRLSDLTPSLTVASLVGPGDAEIRSIHYDSRTVGPGGLFVAMKGLHADGSRFIEDAIARGAVAIVTEKTATASRPDVTLIQVPNARQALASIASQFWGNPSTGLCLIGITGTNGKTTTAYLIESVLEAAGFPVGVIGTIDWRFQGNHFQTPVTTPESADLMEMLRRMKDGGVSHCVLEVSSHAIDMDRVRSCEFDIGVFTNLSQDHLDYHKDMDAYWQCKKRFFTDRLSHGPKSDRAVAVINWDDPRGRELTEAISLRTFRTGSSTPCDVRSEDGRVTLAGTSGTIRTPKGSFTFESRLVGEHNVQNILSATAAGLALGLPLTVIERGIRNLGKVPGRLETVPNHHDLSILVDYAHTPEALENVLTALRKLTRHRLITVFGCGGDRDKTKRPLMGGIASRLSDLAILTTDNPRTEPPDRILAEIECGVTSEGHIAKYEAAELLQGRNGRGYTVEPDRKRAIELGVRLATPGDCLLIAGKGHETYQIVGSRTVPFDDRVEVGGALERLSGDLEGAHDR